MKSCDKAQAVVRMLLPRAALSTLSLCLGRENVFGDRRFVARIVVSKSGDMVGRHWFVAVASSCLRYPLRVRRKNVLGGCRYI